MIKKTFLFLALTALGLSIFASNTYAQNCVFECIRDGNLRTDCEIACQEGFSLDPEPGEGITNPILNKALQGQTGIGFFQSFIPSLVGLGFVIGVIVFFFVFLIGAIQWIASGGDKAALEQARGKIANALVGLFVLFSIFAIITLIENFFGTNILTLDIGVLKIE